MNLVNVYQRNGRQMAKTAAISIRVEPAFKEALEEEARKDGRTLASYVERVLALHHQMPAWKLRDCQPINRRKGGARVALPIAEGWPVAELTAAHAEALGEQLIGAAKIANKIPPAE